MKNKIYTILVASIFVGLIFFNHSCQKKDPCSGMDLSPVTNTYNVIDSDKAKIPYTGFDTLIFKSDAGDTAILFGQGKRDYYINNVVGNGYSDCPKTTTYKYENIEIDFKGTNPFLYQIGFIACKDAGATEVNDLKIFNR